MKKIIELILICTIIMAGAATAYAAEYTDVESKHWAFEAVKTMSDQSVIAGYPDGSFRPNNTITYGEFIKMALIAGTSKDVGNAAAGNWAMNYYSKALELGYFTAYDIDQSALNQQITRAHMALIVSSILGDVKIKDYDEIQKGITDVNYKTKYEYDITKAYATGILTGYTDKTFKPEKTLTRAEAATVIYRLVDESKRVLPGAKQNDGLLTIERMRSIPDRSETVNLAETSTSELLLTDLVSNMDDFVFYKHLKYYEIVYDYPYTMSKQRSLLGTEDIKLSNKDNARSGFIIQGDKLVSLVTVGTLYCLPDIPDGSDFPDFDYIGFTNSNCDTMILVPNPF